MVYREVLLPVTIKLFINELINDEYYTYTYVYMKTVYINKNGSFATYIKKKQSRFARSSTDVLIKFNKAETLKTDLFGKQNFFA